MYYKVEGIDKRFMKIETARKAAVEEFPYYKDMGISNPTIRIYLGNVVGKVAIGKVYKGPGYAIYEDKNGKKYRISSKTGKVRGLK